MFNKKNVKVMLLIILCLFIFLANQYTTTLYDLSILEYFKYSADFTVEEREYLNSKNIIYHASDENAPPFTLNIIESSVLRAGKMVENLLDFSRKKDQEFKEINLYETLNEIISFESKKISEKNIKVTINCNNIFFYIDLEIFTLVILNLLSNAIDVVSEGGEININCYLDDSYLYIDFADTGKGIEPEHIEQIFNPFFTTKATGKGTGLGLYIVYNQLKKINGEISVDSRVDEGTVFKLKFSKGGNYGF